MSTEDKYIPKVGEAFEWRSVCDGGDIWHTAGKCIVYSTKAVGYESPNGWIDTVNKECEFRPIQTKADIEREHLLQILGVYANYKESHMKKMVKATQKAGFTIPKKVKRSDVLELASVELYSEEAEILTNEICNLLGDLVEQDQ
tara:strand:+ start:122 stop:553 length:432 start_codon:yes stop_codon:yes gene_type:complete